VEATRRREIVVVSSMRVMAGEGGWAQRGAGTLLAGLLGLTAFLAWRSLGWPLVHDAPIMHYAAWLGNQGAVPYRDFFDMNFPGAHLLHRLVLALFGPGDWGFRSFDLLWLAATAVLIGGYCLPFGVWSATVAPLLFAAYHLAGGAWLAGQRDFLLAPFLLAGLWSVARAWGSGARLPLVAGGLAFGAAFLLKPHGLLFLPLLGWAGARRGRLALALTAWAIPPLAAGLWLGWTGGLLPFLEILGRYLLPLYSGLERVSPLEALRWHAYGVPFWSLAGFLVLLSLALALVHRRFDLHRRLLAAGVLYGGIHFVAQGKGWEYHLYPLALSALLMATTELDAAIREGGWFSRALQGGGLALLITVLGLRGVEASDAPWIAAKERRVTAVVADLRGRIPPGETVQVLDTTEGGIHALLRLRIRQPTRFLYDFHFFHDAETAYIRGLRSEFVQDLQARPPRFVVLFERGWPRGGYERLNEFPELLKWLERHYALDRQGDGYRIHARR
jgi:hypothetical protein